MCGDSCALSLKPAGAGVAVGCTVGVTVGVADCTVVALGVIEGVAVAVGGTTLTSAAYKFTKPLP